MQHEADDDGVPTANGEQPGIQHAEDSKGHGVSVDCTKRQSDVEACKDLISRYAQVASLSFHNTKFHQICLSARLRLREPGVQAERMRYWKAKHEQTACTALHSPVSQSDRIDLSRWTSTRSQTLCP